VDRHLDWPGCSNARDLGGLPTAGGGITRWGAAVRSDSLDRLTPDGWRALEAHGVRTAIDLRSEIEREAEPYACGLTVVASPAEDDTDIEFIARWRPFSTPHYYRAALEQWPRLSAAAVRSFARAAEGGVVIHCGLGRDRTGLVAALLLALAGVGAGDIADDYELSAVNLPPLDVDAFLANPSNVNPRSRRQLEEDLAAERRRRAVMSDREAIVDLLASLDVEAYLLAAGLSAEDVAAARARLVSPRPPGGRPAGSATG
jgi:protein-tyrosine phosphatase